MNGHQTPKQGLARNLAATVTTECLSALLGIVSRTWRIEVYGRSELDALNDNGTPVMVMFWHGHYVPLLGFARGLRLTALISGTGRGRLLARLCRRFGYGVAAVGAPTGLSSPAYDALRLAVDEAGALTAIAADGPLGPARKAKPGPVLLAAMLGYRVMPLCVRISGRVVLARRWDRMEIPLPFARVQIRFGPALIVQNPMPRSDLVAVCQRLTTALEASPAEPIVPFGERTGTVGG